MNGTNSLKSHLKSCTTVQLKKDDLHQTNVYNFYSSAKKVKIPNKVKLAVLEACVEFSALDGRAFETMNGTGFQNLVQVLLDAGRQCNNSSISAKDVLPHATTISRNVTRLYEQSKKKLNQVCENLKKFCIVVDSWTEKYTGINYCGIALRYVDDNFKLFSFIMGCYAYDAQSHSAPHFRSFVDEKLCEFNLKLDLSQYVVSDNEIKMIAAFRDECTRIGCADHYLNKQLQHAFESEEIHVNRNTVEKVNCEIAQHAFLQVKSIVTHVRISHRQQQLSLKLQTYSKTRFNRAFIMLNIFRRVFNELPLVLSNNKTMNENYNSIEKQLLDDICQFLEPFQEVIEALSEEDRPSLHRVIPLRQCLINKCIINDEDSTGIYELKIFLARRLKNNWLITTEHRLATILHPMLKNFDSCLDEKENAITALKLAFDKYQLDNHLLPAYPVHSSPIISISACSSTTSSNTKSTKVNLLAQCFDSVINTNVKTSDPYHEINEYLNYDYNSFYPANACEGGDIDILSFWREKQSMFPVLSALVKQVYAIPASNTIVERLFSASKNTIGEKRTNLASDKINQLLFLQKNFALLKQLCSESRRKRTISMSSATTISSEDSICTMPKQSRLEDETSDLASDDIEVFFD